MKKPGQSQVRKKTRVIDELIKNYKKEMWNKNPFEKAEFHQCIPNPERPGELITVQLVVQQLEEIDPDESLKFVKNPSQMYQKY